MSQSLIVLSRLEAATIVWFGCQAHFVTVSYMLTHNKKGICNTIYTTHTLLNWIGTGGIHNDPFQDAWGLKLNEDGRCLTMPSLSNSCFCLNVVILNCNLQLCLFSHELTYVVLNQPRNARVSCPIPLPPQAHCLLPMSYIRSVQWKDDGVRCCES